MFFEHLVSKHTEATLKASFQVAFVYSESQPEGWLIALVEIPGFEPGQTEPKSVVLPLHNISIPGAKIPLFLVFCKSEESVDEVPDEESCEFSDQKQDHRPTGAGLVESEGNGDDISDERNPGGECEPYAPTIDLFLLLLQRLRLYLEPFLDPLPFANPSDPIGQYASKPVAQGAYEQTSERVACGCEDSHIENIRAEGEDCRSKEGSDEKAEKAESFKPFHV